MLGQWRNQHNEHRTKGFAISTKGRINRRWLPLNALRAFEAVGQHRSFTAGAAALSVSQ
jgi:LysR family glycine cleavage system transcriptional activator